MRKLMGLALAGVLLLAVAAPASAREFGTVYIGGETYRTFGNPANVPDGTGTDPIVTFTNFAQPAVAQFSPGPGHHGGRWQVWRATWNDLGDAHLLTSYADVLAEATAGNLTLARDAAADFRCPVLPDRGNGS